MSPKLKAFSAVFAPVFTFSLYLLACTASIYPRYQPDIGRIRWFHPGLILIVSFVTASFLARHYSEVVRFLQLTLVLCAVVFAIVLAGHTSRSVIAPTPPAERTLHSTITFALAQPEFSNRSFAAPFYIAVLTAILWLVHRARNNSNERSA